MREQASDGIVREDERLDANGALRPSDQSKPIEERRATVVEKRDPMGLLTGSDPVVA